jgi:hypothetical protein
VSRRNLSLVLTCVVLAASAWFYFHRFHQKPLGAGTESGYVDPAACARCHQDIAKTYRLTGMGRSFFRPSAENTVEDY